MRWRRREVERQTNEMEMGGEMYVDEMKGSRQTKGMEMEMEAGGEVCVDGMVVARQTNAMEMVGERRLDKREERGGDTSQCNGDGR